MIGAAKSRRALAVGVLAALLGLPFAAVRAEEQPVGSVATEDGTVRVEVLSLKRTEGGTVTLRWRVINSGNADYVIVVRSVRLIDVPARKYYEVGLGNDTCRTPPDQKLTCWAMFAAPPANTRSIAVRFWEHLDLISGVPVTE
jgi:hypothetical protein